MNDKDKRHAEARWKQLGLFETLNYSNAEDFIWKYLSIFVEVEKWKQGWKINKRKSLKENLYKTSVMVFENELRGKPDIEKVDFFLVTLQRMSINYKNLGALLLNLIRVNLKKVCKIWFFNLSSLISQSYRGIYFEEWKPSILEGLFPTAKENLNLPKSNAGSNSGSINTKMKSKTLNTIKISYRSGFNQTQILEFDLNSKGFPDSEVYCEDGMFLISPYYQSIYDADIFLELTKRYPYSVLIFFQAANLYLKIVDSIYKQIYPNKVSQGRITIYESLEPGASREISTKSIINIANFNEFIIKSISSSEKNLTIKHISGVYKAQKFILMFDKIYSEQDPGIPNLKFLHLQIMFTLSTESKVFLSILQALEVKEEMTATQDSGDVIDFNGAQVDSTLPSDKFKSNISISLPLTTESNPILFSQKHSIVMEDSSGCLINIII